MRLATTLLLATSGFSGCAEGVTGNDGPMPATLEIVDGDLETGVVGTALVSPLRVRVRAADGRSVAGAAVRFTADLDGKLTDSLVTTDASGEASSRLTLPTTAGTTTVSVRPVRGTGTAVFRFTVSHGAARRLFVTRQPPTAVLAEETFGPVTVEVRDEYGNIATSYGDTVRLALAANAAGASATGTIAVVPVAGVASFGAVSVSRAGSGLTLVASSASLDVVNTTTFTASAAVIRWSNPAGGAWSTASNWSLDRTPLPGDSVVIAAPGTYTVTLDSDFAGTSVLIQGSGGEVTLALAAHDITLQSALRVAMGGVLLASGSDVSSDLSSAGTVIASETTNIAGLVTTQPGSLFRVDAGAGTSDAVVAVAGGFLNRGTIELTNTGIQLDRSTTLRVAPGVLVNEDDANISSIAGSGGGTRVIASSVRNRGTLTVAHDLTIDHAAGGHLNVGRIVMDGGDLLVVMGAATAKFGTFELASNGLARSGRFTIGSGRTMTVRGPGEFVLHQDATLEGAGTFAIESASATIDGTFAVQGLSAAFSALTLGVGRSTGGMNVRLAGSTVNGFGSLENAAGREMLLRSTTVNVPFANGGVLRVRGASSVGAFVNVSGAQLTVEAAGSTGDAALTSRTGFFNHGTIELTHAGEGGGGESASLVVLNEEVRSMDGTLIRIRAGVGGGDRIIRGAIINAGRMQVDHPLTLIGDTGPVINTGMIVAQDGDVRVLLPLATSSFTSSGVIDVVAGRAFIVEGGEFVTTGELVDEGTLIVRGSTMSGFGNIMTRTIILSDAVVNRTLNLTAGRRLELTNTVHSGALLSFGTVVSRGTNTITGAVIASAGSILRIEASAAHGDARLQASLGVSNNGLMVLADDGTGTGSATMAAPGANVFNDVGGTIRSENGAGGGRRSIAGNLINRGLLILDQDRAQSLDVDGTLVNEGDIALDIAGAIPGTQHDRLVVTGTATIGGTLTLTLLNGYVPPIGAEFVAIAAGSIAGVFAVVALPAGLAGPDYRATTVVVTSSAR